MKRTFGGIEEIFRLEIAVSDIDRVQMVHSHADGVDNLGRFCTTHGDGRSSDLSDTGAGGHQTRLTRGRAVIRPV